MNSDFRCGCRSLHPADSIVAAAGVAVGGRKIPIIAEAGLGRNGRQLTEIAEAVQPAGVSMLSCSSAEAEWNSMLQQDQRQRLHRLQELKAAAHMPVIAEIMFADELDSMHDSVDVVLVNGCNMQNFALLKKLGQTDIPVLLKRGSSATIEEWLMSAEYILAGGNANVILCEQGIRTSECHSRHTLDLSAVAAAKQLSHLPVVADLSQSVDGQWMTEPLAKAAIAVGADGLMVSVSDESEQKAEAVAVLLEKLRSVARIMGREI